MESYETRLKVRFGDIDHAGIVYYPRFMHYLHVAFEEFFSDRVGIPYHELLDVRRVGFPTVRAEIDFAKPFVFGDVARIGLDVVHLGRRSLGMRYRIHRGEDEAVSTEARITTVCVDMDTFRPLPIPDDLRRIFADHAPGEETDAAGT